MMEDVFRHPSEPATVSDIKLSHSHTTPGIVATLGQDRRISEERFWKLPNSFARGARTTPRKLNAASLSELAPADCSEPPPKDSNPTANPDQSSLWHLGSKFQHSIKLFHVTDAISVSHLSCLTFTGNLINVKIPTLGTQCYLFSRIRCTL
jgi:hypothetical protein